MIRDVLIECASRIPDNKVALLLSAGMDSQALLFALKEASKEPVVYSFTLEDRESLDFRRARETANIFNCEICGNSSPHRR